MPRTGASAAGDRNPDEPGRIEEAERRAESSEEQVDYGGENDAEESSKEEVEYEEVEEEIEVEESVEEEDEEVEEEDDGGSSVSRVHEDMENSGAEEQDDKEKHAELLSLPPHGSEVYLGGFPHDATEVDLRVFCETVGEVTEVLHCFTLRYF